MTYRKEEPFDTIMQVGEKQTERERELWHVFAAHHTHTTTTQEQAGNKKRIDSVSTSQLHWPDKCLVSPVMPIVRTSEWFRELLQVMR